MTARIVAGAIALMAAIGAWPIYAAGQDPTRPKPSDARGPAGGPELEGTYWKLVQLRDKTVPAGAGLREAYLRLLAAGTRVQGSSGCNTLLGSYSRVDTSLTFKGLAATKMGCPPALASQERDYIEALDDTTMWRIEGAELELIDASDDVVARFQAVANK